MKLDELIHHLGPALRLPPLVLRVDGSSGFRIGELAVLLIARPAHEQAFVARARIGRIEADDFAPVLAQLLGANFFADGVGGAALGLDAQAGLFLTQHFSERGLGFEPALAALDRFVAQAQQAQALLAATLRAAAPATEGVRAA